MKTRLTSSLRETLLNYARRVIECRKEEDALNAAYAAAYAAANEHLVTLYPVPEMKVLKKYGLLEDTRNHRFREESGRFVDLNFRVREEDSCFLTPRDRYYHLVPAALYTLVLAHDQAICCYVAARETILRDYKTLIDSSRTLEDVIDIWPEAAAMSPPSRTALVALTPEVRDRLKRDIATRQPAQE